MTALGRMAAACFVALAVTGTAAAQDMPPAYASVLTALGRSGDFKDGVLKVNIPRSDLQVTIAASGADAVRLRRLGGA